MKKIYIALIIFAAALLVYSFFAERGFQHRNYFAPLANSFLHGRLDVEPKPWLNELVPVEGKYYVVYPPAPALVLLPFAAVFGQNLNQIWPSVLLAAFSVSIFYLTVAKFAKRDWVAILITALFAFGTNFFFTALTGTSWYFAHIATVFFLSLSLLCATSKKPFLTGLFLGLAFLSRLPTILAFPVLAFLVLNREKREDWLGVLTQFVFPVLFAIIIFGLYNFFRFGNFFETGYSLIPGVLQEPWYNKGIFNFEYIPRHLKIIFLELPKFSPKFPYFLPSSYGMALWLTTPALLLIALNKRTQAVLWFLLSIFLIAIPSLVHGTIGFTQFGYRFSLDYILLFLILLIPIFERIGWRLASIFAILSIVINLWVAILFKLGFFHY